MVTGLLENHLLSLVVFGAAAAEFLLLPKFGTSIFFLLTLLAFRVLLLFQFQSFLLTLFPFLLLFLLQLYLFLLALLSIQLLLLFQFQPLLLTLFALLFLLRL